MYILKSKSEIQNSLLSLGDFYQNIHLPYGIETLPGQPPARGKNYTDLLASIPECLSGKRVLDIGCNAGAFSIEAHKRGASKVVGIDYSEKYISQARFCAETLGLDIEYKKADVYDYLRQCDSFDIVIFIGTLYHLLEPISVARLIGSKCLEKCIVETVGVSPKFRNYEEGIIQLPRPRITHSGTVWMNMEALRHLFQDMSGFSEFRPIINEGRIAAVFDK